jgi:anti-sigma factor RsiW
MTDQWSDRLSRYVDEDLPAAERIALEGHLVDCDECRDTIESLRRVAARARGLRPRLPERDLWPGIAQRIGVPRRVPRRLSFTVPQLAAAAVVLAAAGAGALAVVSAPRPAPGPEAGLTAAVWPAAPRIEAATARLEQALAAGHGVLDSATVRVLEHSLAVIDSAISEARRALAADPASAYLNHHLARQMRRKLDLLRRATTIVAAQS